MNPLCNACGYSSGGLIVGFACPHMNCPGRVVCSYEQVAADADISPSIWALTLWVADTDEPGSERAREFILAAATRKRAACCERSVPRVGVLPDRWTCAACRREYVRWDDEAEGGGYVETDGGPWQKVDR